MKFTSGKQSLDLALVEERTQAVRQANVATRNQAPHQQQRSSQVITSINTQRFGTEYAAEAS